MYYSPLKSDHLQQAMNFIQSVQNFLHRLMNKMILGLTDSLCLHSWLHSKWNYLTWNFFSGTILCLHVLWIPNYRTLHVSLFIYIWHESDENFQAWFSNCTLDIFKKQKKNFKNIDVTFRWTCCAIDCRCSEKKLVVVVVLSRNFREKKVLHEIWCSLESRSTAIVAISFRARRQWENKHSRVGGVCEISLGSQETESPEQARFGQPATGHQPDVTDFPADDFGRG